MIIGLPAPACCVGSSICYFFHFDLPGRCFVGRSKGDGSFPRVVGVSPKGERFPISYVNPSPTPLRSGANEGDSATQEGYGSLASEFSGGNV